MKIEIEPIDLYRQKIKKVKSSYIELYDTYLKCVYIFRAEEPENNEEPELGAWNEKITNYTGYVLKSKIAGIDKEFAEKSSVWRVDIISEGINNDISAYFKTDKEATEYANKILNWLFNTECHSY